MVADIQYGEFGNGSHGDFPFRQFEPSFHPGRRSFNRNYRTYLNESDRFARLWLEKRPILKLGQHCPDSGLWDTGEGL